MSKTSTTVYYTKNIDPDGKLKVRIVRGGRPSGIFSVTLTGVPSIDIANRDFYGVTIPADTQIDHTATGNNYSIF